MKIISILNMKGGVGKTTSSINIAQGLGQAGKKVLLVDLDPQANSTDMLLEDGDFIYIDEILEQTKEIVCYKTNSHNVDVIPSRLDLAVTEKNILLGNKAQHNRLHKALRNVKEDYDFIIIDCPPIFNTLIVNALNASDEVIIPIKIDRAAQKGYEITLSNIVEIEESYDLELNYKVLFTMVTRTNIDKSKIKEIEESSNGHCFNTTIRNQAKPIKEATYSRTSVVCGKSGVGEDYKELVEEMLCQ